MPSRGSARRLRILGTDSEAALVTTMTAHRRARRGGAAIRIGQRPGQDDPERAEGEAEGVMQTMRESESGGISRCIVVCQSSASRRPGQPEARDADRGERGVQAEEGR